MRDSSPVILTLADLEALSANAKELLRSLGDEARTKAETFEEAARLYRGLIGYVAAAEAALTGSPQEQAAAFVALVAAIREADSRLKPLSAAQSLAKFNLALTPAGPQEN